MPSILSIVESQDGLTTHSIGARIEWLSSTFATMKLDAIRHARLIRALDGYIIGFELDKRKGTG
jgi:hypothetical protein